MENYPYSSYPDSGNSSPRSREIDCETHSWPDDAPSPTNYKVKFMCSYGGKIHPRPHDNQLTYIGGDTKILSLDRHVRFSTFIHKLSSLSSDEVCFKYQLPGEDLDALISVTNDEDLEHMMIEYDRLYRNSGKPVRMRLFLFPINTPPPASSFGANESKSEREWFVEALNSVQIQQNLDTSSDSAPVTDFLFGLEKTQEPEKLQDPSPAVSEGGANVVGDTAVEFQRLQISGENQSGFQRKMEETYPGAYSGEFYTQKGQDWVSQATQQTAQVTVPATYWSERHVGSGGGAYLTMPAPGNEQPVYMFPTQAGMYQAPAMRPVTGQVSQAYYGMQRMVPEVYREQPVFNMVPQQSVQQQPTMGGAYGEAIGMVPQQQMSGVKEGGFAQVSYDGRQVYYTAPGGAVPQYQAVEVRQSGGALSHQEGKVGTIKGSENYSV